MAEQQAPKLQLRFQDVPELTETLADSVGHWHFDGQLDEAAQVPKAAEAGAATGNVNNAVKIALDPEQPVYEVRRRHNAADLYRFHALSPAA